MPRLTNTSSGIGGADAFLINEVITTDTGGAYYPVSVFKQGDEIRFFRSGEIIRFPVKDFQHLVKWLKSWQYI